MSDSVKGWVCPECGLQYDPISPADAIAAVQSFPRRYREALFGFADDIDEAVDEDVDAVVRRRPDATTWSALEYTAHVRDALEWTAAAVRRINRERGPIIEAYDPDVRADVERYNEQAPSTVLDQLEQSADRLVAEMGDVDASDWQRTGHFPWGERDLLTTARNAVHEGSHHLRDVNRVLRAVVGHP
jgi:hypothetical protein